MATKNVTSKRVSKTGQASSTPQIIITQWLSYAFWGWLMAALVWTMIIILQLVIKHETNSSMVPYAVSSVFVLLPIAFITDWLHRRHGLVKKNKAAAIVMIVHAVLFALIAIGTLIGAVFTGVGLFVTLSADPSTQVVALLSLLVASILFGLLFVRVLMPDKLPKLPMVYAVSMLVLSLGLLVWGVSGPVAETITRKDDARIESYLVWLKGDIASYVQDNRALPDKLADIDASDESKALIDKNLVIYKKDGMAKNVPTDDLDAKPSSPVRTDKLKYQLCVNYKETSQSDRNYPRYDTMSSGEGDYKSYLDAAPHDKGDVCYKLYEALY